MSKKGRNSTKKMKLEVRLGLKTSSVERGGQNFPEKKTDGIPRIFFNHMKTESEAEEPLTGRAQRRAANGPRAGGGCAVIRAHVRRSRAPGYH